MEESELRVAAGAYVAGDLDDADQAAFEALLARNPELHDEVAFWQRCRGELPLAGRPPATPPGPGFAAVIRHRLATSDEQVLRPRFDAWRWAGWAAAAACLVLLIGQWQPGETAFFDEQGNAVVPIDGLQQVVDVAYRPEAEPASSAWLGLSGLRPTPLPLEVQQAAGKDRGLVVFQVEGPAAAAGIRPGDIILNVAECPTFSRVCVRHALESKAAGREQIPVRYWCMREGAVKIVMIDPGELWR